MRTARLLLALCLVAAAPVALAATSVGRPGVQAQTPQDQMLNPFSQGITYAVGIGTALAIAATKRYTGVADAFAWDKVKKLQPIAALPVALGLTYAWQKLGLHGAPPDAGLFLQAPASAIVGVAAAELFARVLPQALQFRH